MPSTWTTNLGLEKPATGEQAGTWGQTANKSYDFIDKATDGGLNVTLSASGYDLITDPGNDSEGRNKVITFTGVIASAATIRISPNTASKIYFVTNKTTATSGGPYDLFFKGISSTGPSFTLKNGKSAIIYCDGAGTVAGVTGLIDDLQLNSLQIITSLVVSGGMTVGGSVTFSGAVTFGGTMTFNGATTFGAAVTFNASAPTTFGALATFNAGAAFNTVAVTFGAAATFNAATTFAAAAAFNAGATANTITTSALTVNLGGDQTGDLLYRTGAGNLGRLGLGANGQFLGTVSGALAWVNINIGTPIVSGTAQCVLFVDGSSLMAQDANLKWTPGTGLAIAGGKGLTVGGSTALNGGLTVTGNVNITGQYQVNGLAFQNNWVNRAAISSNTVINYNSWTSLASLSLPYSGTYAVFVQLVVTQGGQPTAAHTTVRVLAGATDIGIIGDFEVPAASGIFAATILAQGMYTGAPATLTFQAISYVSGGSSANVGTNIMAIWVSP